MLVMVLPSIAPVLVEESESPGQVIPLGALRQEFPGDHRQMRSAACSPQFDANADLAWQGCRGWWFVGSLVAVGG